MASKHFWFQQMSTFPCSYKFIFTFYLSWCCSLVPIGYRQNILVLVFLFRFSPSDPLQVPHKVLRPCVPHAYLQRCSEPTPRASPRLHVWRQPPRELTHPCFPSWCWKLLRADLPMLSHCVTVLKPAAPRAPRRASGGQKPCPQHSLWQHSQSCIACCLTGSLLHPTAIRCLTAPVSEKQVSNGKGSSCVFQPCLSVMFEYLPESLSGVLENLCWKKQHRFSLTWLMSVHRVGAVSLLLDNMIYIWVKNNFLHRVHFVKWFFNKRASCERSLSKEFCTLYVILGQLYSYKPRPVFIDISYKLLWVTVTKPLFLTYMPQQRGCSSRDKQNSGQRCLLLRLAVNLLI